MGIDEIEAYKMSSESTAVVITDFLVMASCIDKDVFREAELRVRNSIDSRKAMGDYYKDRLSSNDLAMIIVNDLIRGGFVQQKLFEKALKVSEAEIDVTKAIGCYE